MPLPRAHNVTRLNHLTRFIVIPVPGGEALTETHPAEFDIGM
jgi:hypothetical protein